MEKYSIDGQAADGNMATNTHSIYVIFIARPLRQYLRETTFNIALYLHGLSCINVVF